MTLLQGFQNLVGVDFDKLYLQGQKRPCRKINLGL